MWAKSHFAKKSDCGILIYTCIWIDKNRAMLLLWFENRNKTEWSAFFAYNGFVVPFCVQYAKVIFLLYTVHMWNIQFAMETIFLSKKKS